MRRLLIEMENPSDKSRGKYLWVLVFVLLIGLCGGCSSDSAKKDSESVPASSKTQETTEKAKVEKIKAKAEFGLGKVSLNDSLDKVHEVLGQEKKTEPRADGSTAYVYDDLNVIVTNGIVTTLESNTGRVATIKGVSQGDSLESVLAAYGEDAIKSTYENLQLYEYDKPGFNGTTCRIRFAINGNQSVEYVSIRQLSPDSGTEAEVGEEAGAEYGGDTVYHKNATIELLLRFHLYITQHRLHEAYNCLGPDLQRQMPYGEWASGFENTVSSTASNVSLTPEDIDRVVLTYDLTATDNPGGTHYFKGTATIVLAKGGWKIYDIENR